MTDQELILTLTKELYIYKDKLNRIEDIIEAGNMSDNKRLIHISNIITFTEAY